jgi:hypothetical protein
MSQKYKIGDINKGVANTSPLKNIHKKENFEEGSTYYCIPNREVRNYPLPLISQGWGGEAWLQST